MALRTKPVLEGENYVLRCRKCGAAVILPFVHHFQLIELLGRGRFGEVYKAIDPRIGRFVAIKFLSSELARNDHTNDLLIKEARLAAIVDHPGICKIFDIQKIDPAFIVMEYVEGETLRKRLRIKKQPHALRQWLDISIEVAAALDAAHDAGLVHCDIKPENIMLKRDGSVKVLDLGLAKSLPKTPGRENKLDAEHEGPDHGKQMGTQEYMSPEQVRGETLDHRSDIFSLGIILCEMVSDQHPFLRNSKRGTLSAILHEEPPKALLTTLGLPHGLRRIISKSLQKNRKRRYESTKDLLNDLKRLKSSIEYLRIIRRAIVAVLLTLAIVAILVRILSSH